MQIPFPLTSVRISARQPAGRWARIQSIGRIGTTRFPTTAALMNTPRQALLKMPITRLERLLPCLAATDSKRQ